MRIAFTNWSNRLAGGAEQYLSAVLAQLSLRGHSVSLWHEVATPGEKPVIAAASGIPSWDVSELGLGRALAELREWEPDVIYCQGMLEPSVHEATLRMAPGVFFAHNYHGTCISGAKTTHFPIVQPCSRRFGPSCLLQYYPRRCGGLNPLTMWRMYELNVDRLRVLRSYKKVVTHSGHVMRDYRNHGIDCESIPFFANQSSAAQSCRPTRHADERWQLLLMGRMVNDKGGLLLLEALPKIADRLSRPITVTFAGDGPDRATWEAAAARLQRTRPDIEIRFPGWLSGAQRSAMMSHSDLLLLPSLWPEPFGMIGTEMAHYSIPTAAFAVGGISDWLIDGVNGCLAPGDPPTAGGFVDAVVRCLSDETAYRKLRAGAYAAAQNLTIEKHCQGLLSILEGIAANSRLSSAVGVS
jgi:glycosyltransferase involved in cell wall biosynthesis